MHEMLIDDNKDFQPILNFGCKSNNIELIQDLDISRKYVTSSDRVFIFGQ